MNLPDLYKNLPGQGNSLVLVDSPPRSLQVSKQNQEKVDGAIQRWTTIHLAKDYSKLKSMCLDMPSPHMQRLFQWTERKKKTTTTKHLLIQLFSRF